MELLVTGAFSGAKQHIRELEEKGHRVHFLQFEKDELPCPPDQIEGVICNGLFLFHAIEKFTRLRFIQLTSAGYDRVPMEYVKANGIQIYNARGVYSIPMAEVRTRRDISGKSRGICLRFQKKPWVSSDSGASGLSAQRGLRHSERAWPE